MLCVIISRKKENRVKSSSSDRNRKCRAEMRSAWNAWLGNTYCEISPVFTCTFWLSFPVWSVTLMFAERLGSPIISIFLVGDLPRRARQN